MVGLDFGDSVGVFDDGGGVEGDFSVEVVDGAEAQGLLEIVGVEDEFGTVRGEEDGGSHEEVGGVGDGVGFLLFDVVDEDSVVGFATMSFAVVINTFLFPFPTMPDTLALMRFNLSNICPTVPIL